MSFFDKFNANNARPVYKKVTELVSYKLHEIKAVRKSNTINGEAMLAELLYMNKKYFTYLPRSFVEDWNDNDLMEINDLIGQKQAPFLVRCYVGEKNVYALVPFGTDIKSYYITNEDVPKHLLPAGVQETIDEILKASGGQSKSVTNEDDLNGSPSKKIRLD